MAVLLTVFRRLSIQVRKRQLQLYLLAAAISVGLVAWALAEAVGAAQRVFRTAFMAAPLEAAVLSPLLFLGAAWLVHSFAPEAGGSGIPQVLRAIETASPHPPLRLASPLVSARTGIVKVASAILGMLGGASVGREGPTVQIASSIFAEATRRASRFVPVDDYRSFIVAGAAAGVSAAFNTPLAGITFALEELAERSFGQFKRMVMLSVVVAGVTARALGGNYLLFGHPEVRGQTAALIRSAFLLGALGGALGGLFSRLLTRPLPGLLPKPWWGRALACGAVCSVFALASAGDTAGSGYEATRHFMDDPAAGLPPFFFAAKFVTTVFSYLSGMAGGIFSPCLAIGSAMGAGLATVLHAADPRTLALIGMVAFFSGVVHAPLTAVIIVMEMTDQHLLIFPFMLAALLAHWVGRLIMPVSLYRHLASAGSGPSGGS